MIRLVEPDLCSGCLACYNACKVGAISVVKDEHGFVHPTIDYSMCVCCGNCKRVCDIANNYPLKKSEKIYAAINRNKNDLLLSSSGGFFPCICKKILELGGAVVGARQEKLDVRHVLIDSVQDCASLYGSKYVQSFVGDVYSSVKNVLKKNNMVLFVGTPCQVAGLKAYLNHNYDNLFTIDLFCHGVSNETILQFFLNYIEKHEHIHITNYTFRGKFDGWGKSSLIHGVDESGSKIVRIIPECKNLFNYAFNDGEIVRPSCRQCRYHCDNRVGDISIGDFWGISAISDMDTSLGVSRLCVNNKRGGYLLSIIREQLIIEELNDCPYYDADQKNALEKKNFDSVFLNGDIEKYKKNISRTKLYKKNLYKYYLKKIVPRGLIKWLKGKKTKRKI